MEGCECVGEGSEEDILQCTVIIQNILPGLKVALLVRLSSNPTGLQTVTESGMDGCMSKE